MRLKQAFIDIKQTLVNIACLAHPSDNASLSLPTDASNVAIGAKVNGIAEILGYFSKTVSDVQHHNSTYDLELLSVYSAIKYFEYILLDISFTVYTDNKALVNSHLKNVRQNKSDNYFTFLCLIPLFVIYQVKKMKLLIVYPV